MKEKDVTLDTAFRVRNDLTRAGIRTMMTRQDDHFIELDDRVAFAIGRDPGDFSEHPL